MACVGDKERPADWAVPGPREVDAREDWRLPGFPRPPVQPAVAARQQLSLEGELAHARRWPLAAPDQPQEGQTQSPSVCLQLRVSPGNVVQARP